MALNAASFLALAVALLTLRRSLRPARSSGVPRPVRERVFLRDALKGLQHIWENRLLFWATVVRLAGLCLTLGSVDLMVYHLQHEAMLSPSAVGLLLSAGALGGMCGNLLMPVLRERLGFSPLYLGGIALSGISLACFGISHQFGALLLCAVSFSFGDAVASISGYTLRMQITPEPLQGRVFSAFQAMIYAGSGVSIALATTLAARAGAGVTLALLGALVALIAAVGLRTPMRSRRPEQHPLYPAA
jgi:MFS family permease